MLEKYNPTYRPMREAFRVLNKLRSVDLVAVFSFPNLHTRGVHVSSTDCSGTAWRDAQKDEIKMRRCAGVYRLPVRAEDIADDLVAMGVEIK